MERTTPMTEQSESERQIAVVDNPSAGQFEASLDGHVGFVSYIKNGKTIILTHTEVPKELQGRGLGNVLARGVLDRARQEGWQVVPRCPFIARYIERHPEYRSLVRP
jgi:predicted GNAT family acetyltransferase